MPQKYLAVAEVATRLEHRGPTTLPGCPPELSGGPAIVCLHGAGGNANEFAPVLDALDTGGDFTPLAYDQPGHGRSGGLDSLGSIEAMASHLRELVRALGLRGAALLGDGMGAAVALEFALLEPDLIRGLVLTGGATAHPEVAADTIEGLCRVVEGKDRRAFDTSGFAPDTPREVYQRAFAEWLKTDPRVTLGDRRAEQAWHSRGRLQAVGAPVLVVVGEHQDADERLAAEALVAALPNARMVEVGGASRRVVLEQPARLADLVAGFLQEERR